MTSRHDLSSEEASTRYVVVPNSLREAATFSGKRGEDPDKWLHQYNNVSNIDKWDDNFCLLNVHFYLDGTAKVWFENCEEFESQLLFIFVNAKLEKPEAGITVAKKVQARGCHGGAQT